jgi:hypothetical protein
MYFVIFAKWKEYLKKRESFFNIHELYININTPSYTDLLLVHVSFF